MARVLLLFEPPDGGVAENVATLALGLGGHGHDVEVAGPDDSVIYPRLRAEGIPVRLVGMRRGYGSPADDLRALRSLGRLLRSGRFDVIHCHSAKAGTIGRLAARLTGVPAIYSPHCFGFVGQVSLARKAFSTGVEWILGRTATTAIVCACEAERDNARRRRLAPADRLRRIYYGVPACDPDVAPDPELTRLREAGPLVAAVTVLRRQKRVDVLLDAAPEVLRRVPDARMVVVGNGELSDELQAQAASLGLDSEERFSFMPFHGPSARYLKALDVYVLPSAWEAMPIGVLEALACGAPQVVTDVEGTGEATTADTGILVQSGDIRGLAEALVALLSDSDRRRQLSAASTQRHAKRFAVERMTAETSELLIEASA